MPQIPPDTSESSGLEVQTSPSNSTNEARGQVNESSEEYPKKSSWKNRTWLRSFSTFVILASAQDVAEAIAESSFSMSHTLTSRFRADSEAWQLGQRLLYPALKAWCAGIPFAILAGFWLSLNPTSRSIAFLPLVPIAVLSSATVVGTLICRSPQQSVHFKEFLDTAIPTHIRSLVSAVPTFLLILIYELVIVKDSLLRSILHPAIWFPPFTFILMAIHFISSQNYRIRTAKLLDILGSPPVRRWEFDTLHAAATFQCLVLCRGLPRPIESIDVLTLLGTFIPDEREVSKVWKARVADRITHEVDISFAPTLPSFGDERQRRLKELLDQAQIGYHAYKVFYDQYVPLHSTTSL
ncbi:hypothetical protein JVT61DRAFT_4717 [Boletus reticuloceps]|uniref:Transmembrane protein n=1 Tax=Boletus reticuloceps TaxID=495285 RepID=A0A8I3A904_9AGAM|nr:hypothetical protein JVT61DRAFT_4717 [Boletus reticuloceps]